MTHNGKGGWHAIWLSWTKCKIWQVTLSHAQGFGGGSMKDGTSEASAGAGHMCISRRAI